jgi:hypothetical protein
VNDLFSFILVMVSLVLAIGVTHLVHGVASLIRLRGRTAIEPLPLVWAASLFLVAAIYWWSLWDFRNVDWRFHHCAQRIVAGLVLVTYLAAGFFFRYVRGVRFVTPPDRLRAPPPTQ